MGVPKLNGIIPAGVQKPLGKKKGKVFVDDADSMLAILGMVQAEKEGEREGKIVKAVGSFDSPWYNQLADNAIQRQLEEIREAKRVEAEKRHESRRSKIVSRLALGLWPSDFNYSFRKKQRIRYDRINEENRSRTKHSTRTTKAPCRPKSKSVYRLGNIQDLSAGNTTHLLYTKGRIL